MSKNYIQILREKLELKSNCHGTLLDLYLLLVLSKGGNTTLKDVHDAWAIWKNTKMPEHRSLIPFDELSPETQELDREYANAIIEVAKDYKL